MEQHRLFEYGRHWLVRRSDTRNLYIYWCRPGTRRVLRRSTRTSDLEEAKRELIRYVESKPAHANPIGGAALAPATRRSGEPHLSQQQQASVIDLLCDYIESLHGKPSQATARYALSIWTKFGHAADLVYLNELTPAMQAKFVAWCRLRKLNTGRVMSNGTINRYLDILRSSARLAQRNGKITTIPIVQLLPRPAPRDRFLTEDEVDRLLAACEDEHVRRFVILSLCTLQRCSAVLGLRVDQVDLAWNRINFLPPDATQSNKRRPTVPIATILRPSLEAWVDGSTTGYVIEHHGAPIKRVRRAFAAACKRAGLQGVTPGVLRHTGATLLAAAGVPIREISGMLGHTTSRMTEEVYAKRRPEFLAQAVGTINALFGNAISQAGHRGGSARQCAPNARQVVHDAHVAGDTQAFTWSIPTLTQPAASLPERKVRAMA